jgi:2-polyprenyl-3-methyl-5-hydroxy-6-metoxy-1,4-benzoquinol methylase/tetratricopeptide (TPR) repeat protein
MSGERVNRLRLEITSHCNMHCVFCPSDELQRSRRHISHEQALRFLRSAPAIGNHIELNVLGEPLLNPRVFEYLDHCEEHGPHVDLVTNATLLDEKRLQRLFGYSKLTLWISLHTPTDRAMRGRGYAAIKTFAAYLNLVCAAIEAKFRYGSHVDLQIHVATELAETETQSDSGPLWTLFPDPGEFEAGWNSCVERMAQLSKTLGEQYPGAYEAETALCDSRYREQMAAGAIVRGAAELARDSANREQVSWMALPNVFFHFKSFKLWTRQDLFLQKHLLPSQLLFTEPRSGPFTCPGANSLVLLSNGEFTLCCLDSDGEMKLGNITDVSPEEVLASPRRREIMENCGTAEVCRRCKGTTFVLDKTPIAAGSQGIDKFGQGFHSLVPKAAEPTPGCAVRWTDGNANAFFYTRIDPAQLHLNFYSPHPDDTEFQAVFGRFDAESKSFVDESSAGFTGAQGEYSHRELPVALRPQSFYRVTLVSPTVPGAAGMALGLGVAGLKLAGQAFDCAGAERERFTMTIAEQSHQRGLELFGQNRYTEAVFWFEHAIAQHETSELWNDWATAQLAANQAGEAERGYRRALELDPANGLAAANLGVLLARSQQPGEAIALLERASTGVQVDPAQRSAIQQCLRQIRAWPAGGGEAAPVLSPAAPSEKTAIQGSSSGAIHAMALAINCRNLDNFSDLLSRIENTGGKAEVIALPWTGDPSHEQLPQMPFKMAAVRPIPELSPAGISESDFSDLLATALKDRPDVLFMGDVQSYPSNVVQKLLKGMDHPPLCIGFQHGLSQCWWMYNRNFACDFLFCFGSRHVLELKKELRHQAIPVGLAKLDRLRDVQCEDRGFIVYVAQSSPEPEIVCPALNRYEEFTGMPVVVHDHPQFPGRYPFRSTLAHRLPAGIDGAQDVVALMAQAALVITPHSTAGLEALYLGKPVVLLPNHGLTAWNGYPGIAHAFTPQSIESARKRALTEPDAIAMFLDDAVGGLRFDHTQRAFDALRGLLDQRAGARLYQFGLGAADKGSMGAQESLATPHPENASADGGIVEAVLAKLDALQAEVDKGGEAAVQGIKSEIYELLGPVGPDYRRKTYNRRIMFELLQRLELGVGDLTSLARREQPLEPSNIRVLTDHPVAAASLDHLQPVGTANDNTRAVPFAVACENLLGRKLKVLDLGCAGGGLVYDFTMRGHLAIGLEGSDYSQKAGRAAWRLIPDRLFTADLTKPFRVVDARGEIAQFDVVSCWEVLEHIEEADLPAFLNNVKMHLRPGGIFAGSISLTAVQHHVTVKPREWWEELLHKWFDAIEFPFTREQLPRGVAAGLFDSADYYAQPWRGVHFCVQQSPRREFASAGSEGIVIAGESCPGPALSLGNAAMRAPASPAKKALVVHVALSPLAAAPIRIVDALNRHTGYEARLVTKSAYAGRSFPNDILWDSGDHRQTVYELLEKASIVHLHHFIDLKQNFLGYDFTAAMRQGKVVVRHFHSNPQHVARSYKMSEEDILNDPLPQFTTTQLHERFYPRAWLMPNLVPLDDEEYRPLPDKDYSRIKVHFQPSRPDGAMDDRWETKACPEVLAVLRGMGDACTVVHSPQAVEYHENLLRRRQCHVAIDDVITGSFHLTSLEALAQGVVAISYLDRRQLWTLSRFTGAEELPWCCLRLEELAQGLPLLLRDRQLLAEMGAASRQWMERYWSPNKMIQHYGRAYDTLLAGDMEAFRKPRFDLSNTSQMWFAQTSDDLSWALHRKRLMSMAGV